MPTDIANTPDELFEAFVNAQTFKTILHSFDDLCRLIRIDRKTVGYGKRSLYKALTSKLKSWKSQSLWTKLDKRGSQKEYENGTVGADMKVCIVGAGPVGLRLAIECALLGARCVVVEKRDRFSRHNVLHLWPYIITDLRNIGAKTFYGKFATGQIEHISIRQLQCILLKIALVLGVEIYPNVTFIDVIEPTSNQQEWRACFKPENHPVVSTYDFSVIIGADGCRNSLKGFQHKEFRGKLAIGVTCNFVNYHTREEQNFEEISGVAKIYNPQFFHELQQQTFIDLENIVYYKNDTHYFVMTAKKQSLLDKNVILQDYPDAARLLARDNVNFIQLCKFACEAAQFATKCSSQFKFQFAEDHHGAADVQMFDFTSLFHAVNAIRIVERNGKQVLMGLVGDSLLESFWPRGSGIGLGFFGLFDTAWSILKFAKREHPLKILVERESIYNLLSQSTPENTKANHQLYSINPASRYQSLNSKSCTIDEIRHLYDSDNIPTIDMNNNHIATNKGFVRRSQSFKETPSPTVSSASQSTATATYENNQEETLLNWCEEIVDSYAIKTRANSKSFQNCLAFCAIVHYYRPDLIDFKTLQPDRPICNFQILFDAMQNQLSIPVDSKLQNSLILSMKSSIEERIRQSTIVILQLLYTHFYSDHHKQLLQRRRSSMSSHDVASSIISPLQKPKEEAKSNNSNVKVSTLVAQYSTHDVSPITNNHNLIGLQSERTPTFCFYCKEKVSIQDWFVVEKHVLHVKCFKCDTCHLQLRKTNYQVLIEPTTGKISFHCRYHNFNKQEKNDVSKTDRLQFGFDQNKRCLSFNETNIVKSQQLLAAHFIENTPTDERASFSLEKEPIDDDKDEIVYSSSSNVINDDDDDEPALLDDDDDDDDDSTDTSSEETTDEEDADETDDELDNEEEKVNEHKNTMFKVDTSLCSPPTEFSQRTHEKKVLGERKQYLSIDSGHIQSESPSPVDLSPSLPSPNNQQFSTSKKVDSFNYSYFRAPCPVCGGSTYDDRSTVEVGKQYYHKACLHCYSCEKLLKDNEYNYYDLSSKGTYQFYCTLHYCKTRLKQVTTTLVTATQQDAQATIVHPNLSRLNLNSNTQSNNNVRLYPSLNDALSSKSHPLNVVNIPNNDKKKQLSIGFEHINQTIPNETNRNSTATFIRSKTFDASASKQFSDNDENFDADVKTTDNEVNQEYKRNRVPLSVPLTTSQTVLSNGMKQDGKKSPSIKKRKKKNIAGLKSNLNNLFSLSSSSSTTTTATSSSSSECIEDKRKHSSNERRRRHEEREKERARFRRSQEIHRELDEIEQRRLELDRRYTKTIQDLNSSFNDERKNIELETQCSSIVQEQTDLQRKEDELLMAKRSLTLENERARAESEYRQLINLPDECKTAKDKEREEQLITTIAKLVEARNNLTSEFDQMRSREQQGDERLRQPFHSQEIENPTIHVPLSDILKDNI